MLLCLSYQGELFYQTLQVFNLVFSDGFLLKEPSEHFHEVDDSILLVEVNIHTFQISIPLLY